MLKREKIAIASDHGGYELKEDIKGWLKENGYEFVDFGTNSADSVDYPKYGKIVGNEVVNGDFDKGILICGTGIGIGNSACKIKGTRVAMTNELFSAEMSRRHNDANILSIGARVIGKGVALQIVKVWLETPFEGGRHQNRVNCIED